MSDDRGRQQLSAEVGQHIEALDPARRPRSDEIREVVPSEPA
ncbi:MAG TPA: hypothetical protein VFZ68_18030 [Acidimicrobiales bacterium]